MIINDKTLISDEVIKENFVCNLNKCKGACCVEGDSGAPLELDELKILEQIYPKVKPLMTKKGIEAVEQQGVYVKDFEGDYTTTCVDVNKECAYVIQENGINLCAIEKAHGLGLIDFKKPISCHLYPIRISKFDDMEALNYDRWSICSDACTFGNQLKVPVYKFLKEPLIRKYGEKWYSKLEKSIAHPDLES